MKDFLLRTVVLGILFFSLFYFEFFPLANYLNAAQTQLTLYGLDIFPGVSRLQGDRIITPVNFHIVINKACNGMIPLLLYLAPVWAYERSALQKMLWSIAGYALLSAVNILRIRMVTRAVEYERESFEIAHDLFGNTLLILTVLLLFVAFIKFSKRTR